MHEPASVTAHSAATRFARFAGAIAGFALLAGTRAFMFTALLGWREPVLSGAGLVLLAAIGWLRWRCRGKARRVPGASIQCAAHRRVSSAGVVQVSSWPGKRLPALESAGNEHMLRGKQGTAAFQPGLLLIHLQEHLMTRPVDSGVILIARIALAVLFLWGGVMKLLGYAGFVGYLHSKGVPFVQIAAPIATAVEALGGLLLIVGFKVRPLALIMAVYAVATAVLGHDFWNVTDAALQRDMVIHFWKDIGIAGGFLLLFVTGAGRISIDGARAPRGGLGF
ncbi:MAG: putative membrane protein [uncultured Paraburkholderia sp.]|nr:MAG: putative membrane protein [uncultured Paraburkholderia sp.]CAH2791794.1 MAG: putative membrane protein [uncultured Paraburkholderia sp.]CAH2925676.1 MAG: putative membrane protein [uncultured Paraburkholderia sp.]